MTPLVSIGMPIRNEERFLAETLASLLGQDYENLEIIISDNFSTDKTPEICRAYAKKDNRIRYCPTSQNIGLIHNFNRAFQLSLGDYFMWASGHDLREKEYIRNCMQELLNNPQIVLATGQCYHMNEENGSLIPIPKVDTLGLSPGERFWKVIQDRASCYGIYGLFRKTALSQTRLKVDTFFPDYVLMAELSLLGEFSFSNPARSFLRNFSRRDALEGEDESMKVARLLPLNASWIRRFVLTRFPFTQFTLEILSVLYRSKLSLREKWHYTTFNVLEWKTNLLWEFTTRWIPRKARKALKQLMTPKAALS